MLHKLEIQPGIVSEDTDYASGPRWVDSDKVRFRFGRPQKIGGWSKYSSNTFQGITRALIGWAALDGSTHAGVGTHKKLYVLQGGTFNDVTPERDSGSLGADPFTTTSGSAVVSVSHTSHGVVAGDFVIFAGAAAFNNVTIVGEYEVTALTDANTYTITDDETANATGAGGGAGVTYIYLISTGTETGVPGLGWGAGTWNLSTWGTARSTSSITLDLRTWTLDTWGEDMLANPRGGDIYVWDKSAGVGTRATKIANAPLCNFILVSDEDRHLTAFGAYDGSAQDPLLVRWSDQEDYDTWTPAAGNTAGDMRLQDGTKIVGAVRSRGATVILTDNAAYAMQLIQTLVFGFHQLGTSCGLVGPHAIADLGGVVIWMGTDDFYLYDGMVRPIPCPIRDHVFDDIAIDQGDQFYLGINKEFREITWFYCSNGATQCDRYVTLNMEENLWYYGTLARSAWLDDSFLTEKPLAAGFDGFMYIHETGTSADGAAIEAHLESGELELGQGDYFMFIDRIIPDFDMVGTVNISLKLRPYPTGTEITKGPYSVTPTTTKIDLRARGRQAAIRLESDQPEDEWRLGTLRLRMQEDGQQ